MSRIYKLYLNDILECCEKISDYTDEMSFEEFSINSKTIDAVARNLEIIGEAVKNIPNDILNLQSDIEWKKVAWFRDVIVHHYFKVDLEIVWDILQNYLPSLEKAVTDPISKINE